MAQRVVDRRFQVTQLLAGVIAAALEHVTVEVALANELAQRVGELNLTGGATLGFLEQRKDVRRKDVATDDRVPRRRVDLRFLDHVLHAEATVAEHVSGYDP